jgi:hypothetical protein
LALVHPGCGLPCVGLRWPRMGSILGGTSLAKIWGGVGLA